MDLIRRVQQYVFVNFSFNLQISPVIDARFFSEYCKLRHYFAAPSPETWSLM